MGCRKVGAKVVGAGVGGIVQTGGFSLHGVQMMVLLTLCITMEYRLLLCLWLPWLVLAFGLSYCLYVDVPRREYSQSFAGRLISVYK